MVRDVESESPRVLIIDDDESMRLTTAAALEHCETYLAESAARAVKLMTEIRFDAVICDMVMPAMTGAELYDSLPVDSVLRHRFLFMTGGGLPVAIQSFLALTAVPILKKPFRVSQLREAVDSLVAS
ncbi:MAG: response regulator [Myxococcales bacterium]|nr:response regulator [Myxococcales bacterium]